MITVHIPPSGSPSIPKEVQTYSATKPPPLLWVWASIGIALVVILFVAQRADTLPIDLAVEIEPAVLNPFNQRLQQADSLATEKQAYLNNLWLRMTGSEFSH